MNKILIIGEAWGEQEALARMPFVGPSGYLLTQLLTEAGIRRADCYLTNVFNLRPEKNDVETLCTNSAGDHCGLSALRPGKYVRREYLPEISRLYSELEVIRPNLIIAAGATAAWATIRDSRISKIRGTVSLASINGTSYKVLPVFHPAAILRQWDLKHVTTLDFLKAKRESEFPEIRRPRREVWIEPSLEDCWTFYHTHLVNARRIAPDIETNGDMITCIGFSPSPSLALVVPFWDPRRPNWSYWSTAEDELKAWDFVQAVLNLPAEKVFQNGLYDMSHMWRNHGITVRNAEHDTMLLHHALQPESPKGLDFLGSVYTEEQSWKLMRARGKTTIKREE